MKEGLIALLILMFVVCIYTIREQNDEILEANRQGYKFQFMFIPPTFSDFIFI